MNRKVWFFCCLRRAWRRIADHPRSAAIAMVAIAAILFVVGVTKIAHNNMSSAVGHWGRGVHMVIYLDDHVTTSQAHSLSDRLRGLDAVEHTRYLSAEDNLDSLRADALASEAMAQIDTGLIPSAIEVELASGVKNLAAANPVVRRLRDNPWVADIEFLGDWVDEVTTLGSRSVAMTARAHLVVLVLAAFVVAAFVRSRASQRHDEEKVLDLLGVTALGRRLLVGLEGAMLGVGAAMVAVVGLWLAFSLSAPTVTSAFETIRGPVTLEFLEFVEVAALVAFAAAAGLAAGVIPARTHDLR